MRKLVKKSLDELATEMPVISEEEQCQYGGGTIYCDLSGCYLGQVGAGTDLKFCSYNDFLMYMGNALEGRGISFSDLNNAGQYNFILENSTFTNVQFGRSDNLAAGLDESGLLLVNEYDSAWNNYYDALSTLRHEEYHAQKGHYALTGDEAIIDAEIKTYLNQLSSSTFAATSDAYKRRTAEALYDYYLKKGEPVSLQELYKKAGVSGY